MISVIDHGGAALGALGEEIDPALGDTVAGGVVGQASPAARCGCAGCGGRPAGTEQAREMLVLAQRGRASDPFRSTSCRAMMIFCISLVPSPMHSSGASR